MIIRFYIIIEYHKYKITYQFTFIIFLNVIT